MQKLLNVIATTQEKKISMLNLLHKIKARIRLDPSYWKQLRNVVSCNGTRKAQKSLIKQIINK